MENEMLPEDLEILLKNDEPLLIIDVRSPEEYADRHLEGAINIPLDQLNIVASFLDKQKFYLTVCGKGGGRSIEGSTLLRNTGLISKWLNGGTFGFIERKKVNKNQ